MGLFDEAIVFAVRAHSGMTRKGSGLPYIVHPMEAAAIAAAMTDDEEVLAAAVLHDVLEDTPATAEEIRAQFGERVARLVQAESENKREERPAADTWEERKRETIEHLQKETDLAVKMLTLSDKLSNLRAMQRDYAALGETFWQRFNQKDKSRHAWYYRAIAEATKELSSYEVWKEYAALVEAVFA